MKRLALLSLLILMVAASAPAQWEPTIYGSFSNSATWTCPYPSATVKYVYVRPRTATVTTAAVNFVQYGGIITNRLLSATRCAGGTNTPLTEYEFQVEAGDRLEFSATPIGTALKYYVIHLRDKQLR